MSHALGAYVANGLILMRHTPAIRRAVYQEELLAGWSAQEIKDQVGTS